MAGRSVCPFCRHQREDEAFFVLSGRGMLRYGEQARATACPESITNALAHVLKLSG